jgi:hypothetical protein
MRQHSITILINCPASNKTERKSVLDIRGLFNYSVHLSVLGPEVITAVVMKSSIFWDRLPCSPVKVN